MISYVIWNLFITAGFVAAALAIWLMWFRFPDRTIDDVTDYLLPVDFEKAEGLLDPQTEAILRKELSPEEFRALQRIMRAVDLDRVEMPAGVGQLVVLSQPWRIKIAAPAAIPPAGDADADAAVPGLPPGCRPVPGRFRCLAHVKNRRC